MSITRISTNVEAVIARIAVQQLERSMNKSMSHIATGSRLTSASDDPSSLSIYNTSRAQLEGFRTAQTNAQDGLALLGTADNYMTQLTDKLISMRDLAVRAANDATLSTADKTALNSEFSTLFGEIAAYQTLSFNGVNLFDTAVTGLAGSDIYLQLGPQKADSFKLDDMTKGVTGASTVAGVAFTASTITASVAAATKAINKCDSAITALAGQQALLGGQMRYVETKLADLQNSEVNMASAVGMVGDADIAAELSEFARAQILSQAATAMMAQANLVSGQMLGLLM